MNIDTGRAKEIPGITYFRYRISGIGRLSVVRTSDNAWISGADPRMFKLELTESLLVYDVEEAIEKMFALRAKGVRFSLDDFGTSYSSLALQGFEQYVLQSVAS